MSSLAFSVEWDDGEGEDVAVEGPQAEMAAPMRAVSEGQGVGTAWEINFTDPPGQVKSKKFMPKLFRESKSSPDKSKKSPSSPNVKSTSSMRSSSAPMKANGTQSFMKPASLAALSKPKAKPVAKRSVSERVISPKKQLPAIRKPLLPVTSPTKKTIQFPELRSQSECILSPRALNRAATALSTQFGKKERPHSASPSVGSAGQKQTQKVQSPQQLKQSQENKQSVGLEKRRVKKDDDARPVDERAQKGRLSLPAVNLSPMKSTQDGPRLARHSSDMAQRKTLDLKRWYCMSHPQYSKSCGISSVVSCWNYLFSTLGSGILPPVTQEQALTLLGFKPPFGEIRFGPFTGNMTCMRWFQTLCDHYGTSGRSYYFYKPVGPRKTVGMRPSVALEKLQEGLNCPDTAFIYHCYNHYFCPIGYEQVPKLATDAYRVGLCPSDVDTWILIGEPSRTLAPIHCKRWDHIVNDLTCELPQYFNIRHTERGILTKSSRRAGTNLHCIMAFKKLQDSITASIFRPAESNDDMLCLSEVEELNSSDSDLPSSPQDRYGGGANWDGSKFSVDDVDIGSVASAPELIGAGLESKNEISVHSAPEGSAVDSTANETLVFPEEINVSPKSGNEVTCTPEEINTVSKLTNEATDTHVPKQIDTDSKSNNEPVGIPCCAEASEVVEKQDEQELSPRVGGLRRSGTFTKEKSTLNVEQTRPLSSGSDSSVDYLDTADHDHGAVYSGNNLEEGSESEGDSPVGGSSNGSSPGNSPVRLKRSGTFTKEKPSILRDGLDASFGEGVDLDDTLKASDFF